jgi:N-acetylmuramoyl-L-alanine amidase
MIFRCARAFIVAIVGFVSFGAAAEVTVQNLRQYQAPDHTRLVFDLSGPLEHRLFVLTEPDRVVLDLDGARLKGRLPELNLKNDPLLAAVRTGVPESGTVRVVFDVKTPVQPRSTVLKPAGPYGHRLVLDLYDPIAAIIQEKLASETTVPKELVPPDNSIPDPMPPARNRLTPTPVPLPERADGPKTYVIAIDPGHGGEDPGAIGQRYRTREKDVTLAIAREVARLINRTPGMRAVLIRDGDYYVGLRERYSKARAKQADLFISIHADAAPNRRAAGSSVYALSEKGASDAMSKHLADKENASDLIGGVSLSDKDDVLAKVLLDLSQTKTISDSLTFGSDILSELKLIGPTHGTFVRQAGFAVLKAPDIPSVLIETAFLSNPAEELKLRSSRYQRQMAESIVKGIKRYLSRSNGTTVARGTSAAGSSN